MAEHQAETPVPSPPLPDTARPQRRGVFDPNAVRFVVFVVISLSLFGTAAVCILAVWDYASHDTAWRSLSTLGIIAATMMIFSAINEAFGAGMDPPRQTPNSAMSGSARIEVSVAGSPALKTY